MARFEAPVMNTSLRAPASSASCTAYWISGLSTTGSISLGMALVAGKKRVPRPATGSTALRTRFLLELIVLVSGAFLRPCGRESPRDFALYALESFGCGSDVVGVRKCNASVEAVHAGEWPATLCYHKRCGLRAGRIRDTFERAIQNHSRD